MSPGRPPQALHPLFQAGEEAGVRDNAAGAVGRLLAAFGGAVPLEAVAPVLLTALPLSEVRGAGRARACCNFGVVDVPRRCGLKNSGCDVEKSWV